MRPLAHIGLLSAAPGSGPMNFRHWNCKVPLAADRIPTHFPLGKCNLLPAVCVLLLLEALLAVWALPITWFSYLLLCFSGKDTYKRQCQPADLQITLGQVSLVSYLIWLTWALSPLLAWCHRQQQILFKSFRHQEENVFWAPPNVLSSSNLFCL